MWAKQWRIKWYSVLVVMWNDFACDDAFMVHRRLSEKLFELRRRKMRSVASRFNVIEVQVLYIETLLIREWILAVYILELCCKFPHCPRGSGTLIIEVSPCVTCWSLHECVPHYHGPNMRRWNSRRCAIWFASQVGSYWYEAAVFILCAI